MAASRETLASSLSTNRSATMEELVWTGHSCPQPGADRPFAEARKQRPGPSEPWQLIDPGGGTCLGLSGTSTKTLGHPVWPYSATSQALKGKRGH